MKRICKKEAIQNKWRWDKHVSEVEHVTHGHQDGAS
jgi:hypothetical protein